jgi:hypothetical protein
MSEPLLDRAGRPRSPATMSGFHAGRPPRNKGLRYPADPPRVEEIIAVMRAAGDRPHGRRLRGLIVILWRAGLRIHEALALAEVDLAGVIIDAPRARPRSCGTPPRRSRRARSARRAPTPPTPQSASPRANPDRATAARPRPRVTAPPTQARSRGRGGSVPVRHDQHQPAFRSNRCMRPSSPAAGAVSSYGRRLVNYAPGAAMSGRATALAVADRSSRRRLPGRALRTPPPPVGLAITEHQPPGSPLPPALPGG